MQVAARCEQFEGGVEGDPGLVIEGDPGLVRQDMQSSWEGLPAGEGLNIVQIKPDQTIISTCKTGSKRHIILIKVFKKCVSVKSQNDHFKPFKPGHDVEGNEAASGRRLKISSKFLILLNYSLWF